MHHLACPGLDTTTTADGALAPLAPAPDHAWDRTGKDVAAAPRRVRAVGLNVRVHSGHDVAQLAWAVAWITVANKVAVLVHRCRDLVGGEDIAT